MIGSWTFQRKVSVGFSVMVGLVALTTAISVYTLRSTIAIKDTVISRNAEAMILTARLDAAVNKEVAAFRGYVATPDDPFRNELNLAHQELAEVLPLVERSVYTDQGRRLMEAIVKGHDAWQASQTRTMALRTGKNGLEAATKAMRQETLPLRTLLAARMGEFSDLKRSLYDQAGADSSARASFAGTLLIGIGVISVAFAAITAVFLARSLSRQIGAAVQHVQSSSAELQTSANQQASGAKEAATAMNEITTTVSELLASSRQISESAQRVTQIADETARAAMSGDDTVMRSQQAIEAMRRQVDQVVNHMLNLGKKSQQIGVVLDIINEMAEQTNILSINATIEAAGAGENGKRFAVVGDEIRKLADRVSGSTKEIRSLVEEIRAAVNTTILATEAGSKAVDAGVHWFAEVTRGFKEIAGMVTTTTQAAREIGLSTKQQMTAVEQVNLAVGGAAQASREAEASSTQTLQTAVQLAQLSHNLSRIVQTRAAV